MLCIQDTRYIHTCREGGEERKADQVVADGLIATGSAAVVAVAGGLLAGEAGGEC